MKTDKPATSQKAVTQPSQNAGSLHSFRLQMALDQAAKLSRGERIKWLRENGPYTQQAIADHCGVTLRAYQRWEEGKGIEWDHLESLTELHGGVHDGLEVMWLQRGTGRGPTPDPFARPAAPTPTAGEGEVSSRLAALEEGQAEIQRDLGLALVALGALGVDVDELRARRDRGDGEVDAPPAAEGSE